MNPGEFLQKLQKLNPRLRVWCGDDMSKPAGLYYMKGSEYTQICGVDKSEVPEFKVVRWDGRIIKQGWRDTLRILAAFKLIDLKKAEKVFGANLKYSSPIKYLKDPWQDPLQKKREELWKMAEDGYEVQARDLADLAVARKRRQMEGRYDV